MSSFALNPSDGPPRLFRYYRGGDEMPTAILDTEHNLLFINEDKFSRLSSVRQHILLRTKQPITP